MKPNPIVQAAAAFALSILACDKSAPPAPEAPAAPAASAATAPAETGAVQLSGSSALQPLVNAAKEKYEAAHKGVSIEVSAGGSKKGLTDVASGAVHIGNSDIFAPADLQGQLVDHRVGVVGFAAMANKGAFDEKVTAISMADMAKVFSGTITNWKQLGGGSQPIVIINRSPNSGTRAIFGSVVLGGDKFIEGQTEDNSGALVAKLKQTTGAISYLALSFADPDLQVLGLKSEAGATIEPTAANITSGSYPIWSYEHMYTKGQPNAASKAFLDYMSSPTFQEQVLPTVKGFIPVTQMKTSRDKD
jgi:phosphate transport system substrate-binding protein